MTPEYGIYTYLYIGDTPFRFVGGGFWRMDNCFTKNLDMVLYSHSKGSGKHRNGTRTPGSTRRGLPDKVSPGGVVVEF